MADLIKSQSRLFRRLIDMTSGTATISRPDSPSENKYGKVEDSDLTYTDVDTEKVHRMYISRDDLPSESQVRGGRLNSDDPRLAFMDNTEAQEDDHVTFDDTGRTYVLDERIPRISHVEFRATLVNDVD